MLSLKVQLPPDSVALPTFTPSTEYCTLCAVLVAVAVKEAVVAVVLIVGFAGVETLGVVRTSELITGRSGAPFLARSEVWRTLWVWFWYVQLTVTATRLKSSGCESPVPVGVVESHNVTPVCEPYWSGLSSIEHRVAVTVYVKPPDVLESRRTIVQLPPDVLASPGSACSVGTRFVGLSCE